MYIFYIFLFIFLFFIIAILYNFIKLTLYNFLIFRNEPIFRCLITNSKGKKIKGLDISKMYKSFKKNDINIDSKFANIFKHIIKLNNSDYHAYFLPIGHIGENDIFVFFHGLQCCIFTDDFTDEKYKHYMFNDIKKNFDILIVEHPGLSINTQKNKTNFNQMLNEVNKWLNENYFNKKKIIVGHSFGCFLALRCANLSKIEYDGVIIVNPFRNIKSVFSHIFKNKIFKFLFNFINLEFDCVKEVKNLKCNLKIIKLKNDKICPPIDSEILFNSFKNNEKYKCEIFEVLPDSKGRKYKHHEFSNEEQILYYAKCFSENIFAEKFKTYEDYKNMLQSNCLL